MRRLALLLAGLAPAAALAQSWTYRYADLQFGRHKAEFQVTGAPEPQSYSARDVGGGKFVFEFASGLPPESWPAPSGYPTYATPYLEWTYSVKQEGWEQVTVPGGTFKAAKVTVTGERGKDPDPFWWPKQAMRFTQTFWYAPEAKRYVKSVHRAWNMNQAEFAHDLVELTAYQP